MLTKKNEVDDQQMSDIAKIVLAATENMTLHSELTTMLRVLSSKWPMFSALLTIEKSKELEEHKEAEAIKQELAQAVSEEQKLAQEHQATTIAHAHVGELEKQLNDMMFQKQQLEQELQKLKTHMATPTAKQPVAAPTAAVQQSQNVRIIPADKASSIGLPAVPDVPNIILGILKDPRGNILPGILVEIKDKDGNPVRAFKTNGLGQFASATPLSNGVYTITFEDLKGKQEFEVVQIEAKGEIMLPIEVISHDAREALRKELFA